MLPGPIKPQNRNENGKEEKGAKGKGCDNSIDALQRKTRNSVAEEMSAEHFYTPGELILSVQLINPIELIIRALPCGSSDRRQLEPL